MFVSVLLSPLLLGIRVLLPLLAFHLCPSLSLLPLPFSISQASTSANMEAKYHEFSVHVCAMTPCIDLLLNCNSPGKFRHFKYSQDLPLVDSVVFLHSTAQTHCPISTILIYPIISGQRYGEG